jgi:hypothetical protein
LHLSFRNDFKLSITMKLFIAATTLAVSAFSMASSVVNGAGVLGSVLGIGGTTITVGADLLHKILFSMDDVDTEERGAEGGVWFDRRAIVCIAKVPKVSHQLPV